MRDDIFDQLNNIKKIIIPSNATEIEDRVVVNIFSESFKVNKYCDKKLH